MSQYAQGEGDYLLVLISRRTPERRVIRFKSSWARSVYDFDFRLFHFTYSDPPTNLFIVTSSFVDVTSQCY